MDIGYPWKQGCNAKPGILYTLDVMSGLCKGSHTNLIFRFSRVFLNSDILQTTGA